MDDTLFSGMFIFVVIGVSFFFPTHIHTITNERGKKLNIWIYVHTWVIIIITIISQSRSPIIGPWLLDSTLKHTESSGIIFMIHS